MSSSYSSSLRVELIGDGDQAGTWGATTDGNFAYIFDAAIAGYQAVTITSTSQLLTSLNGPTSSAALNQSVYAILKFNSASAATNIFAPPVSKQYIIWNNSGYAITIYNSAVINVIPSPITTTGVTIANGDKVMVWSDGTNFYDTKSSSVTGTVAIANGGTGQTTANAAFNALAPVQTSANGKYLKSDGTNTSWDAIDISTSDVSGVLLGANGGTGVANTGKTITLGGNLTHAGAFTQSFTATGNTAVTLPTTGTLATLAGTETLTNKTLTSPTINSPTLTSPALGTPSSGNLSNCTFPTLNQNTTGTAAGLSATLAIASGGTGVTTAAAITALVGNLLFPVGSMYSNASVATNPGTLLGFGTWTAIGMGRVLIGAGTNGPNTFTAGATGGAFDSTLPSHTHTATSTVSDPGHYHVQYPSGGNNLGNGAMADAAVRNLVNTQPAFTGVTVATSIASSGSSPTNTNLPPYIVVYMWYRTA